MNLTFPPLCTFLCAAMASMKILKLTAEKVARLGAAGVLLPITGQPLAPGIYLLVPSRDPVYLSAPVPRWTCTWACSCETSLEERKALLRALSNVESLSSSMQVSIPMADTEAIAFDQQTAVAATVAASEHMKDSGNLLIGLIQSLSATGYTGVMLAPAEPVAGPSSGASVAGINNLIINGKSSDE
jgi:hypothetical protein